MEILNVHSPSVPHTIGAPDKEILDYVRDAIKSYRGCYDPDSASYRLSHRAFTARLIKEKN